MKEYLKLLSIEDCDEITEYIFFHEEYAGIYHKSFLSVRQEWIQIILHLVPSSTKLPLYKHMKACQCVSQMAIQEDTSEVLEQSRDGIVSPIPLREHYSRLLLFEKNADKSVKDMMEIAVKDGLNINEILFALRLLEKAYQMNANESVKEYIQCRIEGYVEEVRESLRDVSEWLMEWFNDMLNHEKPLLKECSQTIQLTLKSLYSSCGSDSMKLSLESLCQSILFIITVQGVEDPSLTLTLTQIISACLTEGRLTLTHSSLDSLAESLIELLEHSDSHSFLPLIHTSEILLERLVVPSAYISFLPSISLSDILPLFTQSQSILAYASRHFFFDSLALARTHAFTSHSPQFPTLTIRPHSRELQQSLCYSGLATLLRIDNYVDALFFSLSPLFVGMYPLLII